VKNDSLDKRNKRRLSKDLVALGLVVAISLLLFYAYKLLINHNHDYYSQSNNHQSFAIAPELIEEAKEHSEDIKEFNNSSATISGIIDSKFFSDEPTNALSEVDTEINQDITKIFPEELSQDQSKIKADINDQVELTSPEENIVSPEELISAEAVNTDESWLLAQPKNNYSLQLASFKDPKLMDVYINKQADIKNLDYKKLESKNGWLYLLVGSFTSNQEAQRVKQSFSFSKDIWVRRIGVLRANRCKNKGLNPNHPSC